VERGGGLALFNGRVQSSTITGNSAGFGGGAVTGSGGIKYGDGPARIDDSTVSGNAALGRGGGVGALAYSAGGTVVRNSTIASNVGSGTGGGIYAATYELQEEPGVSLKSSIVADNTASGAASDLGEYSSGGFAAGFTLVESPGTVVPDGDPAGTNLIGVDPQLAPLAANGGVGQTHAIAPTSPAVDFGQANGFTTDQRGQPRTVDAAATNSPLSDGTDIGAFELTDASATGDDPETKITKKPKKKLKLKDGKQTVKVKLKFKGTDNAAPPGPLTFECKIDKGPFEDCKSPLKLELDKGKHKIQVRAIDADGNVDSSPAKAKTKVK